MKAITEKINGAPSAVESIEGNASYSETPEEIKVCHATDCDCTARKGYTCSHAGPCKQIVGNNTEQPRCPDCGSIALKFATRDYCEGDYYWCHACGCGPIKFPLELCLSREAREAAETEIRGIKPVMVGNKAVCQDCGGMTGMCQPDNHCGHGACGKIIDADGDQARSVRTEAFRMLEEIRAGPHTIIREA